MKVLALITLPVIAYLVIAEDNYEKNETQLLVSIFLSFQSFSLKLLFSIFSACYVSKNTFNILKY